MIKFSTVATYAERALKAAVARRTHEDDRAKREDDRAKRVHDRELKRNRLAHERRLLVHSRALRMRLVRERDMTMSEVLAMRETAARQA